MISLVNKLPTQDEKPAESDGVERIMPSWPIKVVYPLEMMLYQSPFSEEFIETFLRTWGSFETETLLRVLDQGEDEERLFTIFALGFEPQMREQLRPFLHSLRSMERWASAISLGRMKDEQALPVLLEMLTEFLPPSEQYSSDGTFEWRYDLWRCHIPSLLMAWKSSWLVPIFRGALQKILSLVQTKTPDDVQKLLQGIYQALLTEWNRYLDEIVYALGRLGAFGVFTGLEGVNAFLSRWIIHLVMGHLHEAYPNVSIMQWSQQPALYKEVVTTLEQRFGLTKEERDIYLTYYEEAVLNSTLLGFPLEQEWDKSVWVGYND